MPLSDLKMTRRQSAFSAGKGSESPVEDPETMRRKSPEPEFFASLSPISPFSSSKSSSRKRNFSSPSNPECSSILNFLNENDSESTFQDEDATNQPAVETNDTTDSPPALTQAGEWSGEANTPSPGTKRGRDSVARFKVSARRSAFFAEFNHSCQKTSQHVSDKDEPNEYEALRLGNIAKNNAILASLGIASAACAMQVSPESESRKTPKRRHPTAKNGSKKRNLERQQEDCDWFDNIANDVINLLQKHENEGRGPYEQAGIIDDYLKKVDPSTWTLIPASSHNRLCFTLS